MGFRIEGMIIQSKLITSGNDKIKFKSWKILSGGDCLRDNKAMARSCSYSRKKSSQKGDLKEVPEVLRVNQISPISFQCILGYI